MIPCSASQLEKNKKPVPDDENEEENLRRKLLELVVDSLIPRRSLATKGYDKCAEKVKILTLVNFSLMQNRFSIFDCRVFFFQGKVAFVSAYGMHQLHIFIFVLAVCHVIFCIVTYALGKTKVYIPFIYPFTLWSAKDWTFLTKSLVFFSLCYIADEKVGEVGRGD